MYYHDLHTVFKSFKSKMAMKHSQNGVLVWYNNTAFTFGKCTSFNTI